MSKNSAHTEGQGVAVWEFLAADLECIKGVGYVSAVFEQRSCFASDFVDDFGLYKFFAGLFFVEGIGPRLTPIDCTEVNTETGLWFRRFSHYSSQSQKRAN